MSLNAVVVRLVIALLDGFHRWLSPVLGPACRFEPSCSRYAAESISEYGLLRGSWLAGCRLSRCQPWGGAGFDPVPRR